MHSNSLTVTHNKWQKCLICLFEHTYIIIIGRRWPWLDAHKRYLHIWYWLWNAVRAPLPCQQCGWTRQKPWRRTGCQGRQQFRWSSRWFWVKDGGWWQDTASGHHLLTTMSLRCSIDHCSAISPSLLRSICLSHLPQQLITVLSAVWTTGSSV